MTWPEIDVQTHPTGNLKLAHRRERMAAEVAGDGCLVKVSS